MNSSPATGSRSHGALAVCCGAIAAASPAGAALEPGYTAPGAVTERGKAPHMQVRLVSGSPGEARSYAIVFGKGDHVVSGLTEWAEQENIRGGRLIAVGALASAKFGWFDNNRKAYHDIPIDTQVECLGLTGDIGSVGDKPMFHIHGSVGLPDGSVRGGHLLEAVAFPTLEVFVDVTAEPLRKEHDAETSLYLFAIEGDRR